MKPCGRPARYTDSRPGAGAGRLTILIAKRSVWAYFWHGAAGGTVGPLLFSLYTILKNPYDILAVPYLPLILLLTGAVGGAIGLLIWAASVKLGWRLGVAFRVLLGVAFSMLLWGFYQRARSNHGVPRPRSQSLYEMALFGVIIGALPGALTRPSYD